MSKTVVFTYEETDWCQSCGKDFDANEVRFKGLVRINTYLARGRIREVVNAECVCKNCALLDAAHVEAADESRRVTKICVGIRGSNMADIYGSRCLCGRVTLVGKDSCLLCGLQMRLLSRADAEAKIIRRMIADMNRQIKETKKLEKEMI